MLLVMTPWRNLDASGPETEIKRRDVSLVRPERRSVCVDTVPENGRRCCGCRRCTDRQPRQTKGVEAARAVRWRKAAEAGPATAIDLVAGCMVGWCSGALLQPCGMLVIKAMQFGTGGGTWGMMGVKVKVCFRNDPMGSETEGER